MIILSIVFLALFLHQFEFFFEDLKLPLEIKDILRKRLILVIVFGIGLLISGLQSFHLLW